MGKQIKTETERGRLKNVEVRKENRRLAQSAKPN